MSKSESVNLQNQVNIFQERPLYFNPTDRAVILFGKVGNCV